MDVLDIMQANYQSLSRTQKQIADYYFCNTDKACFMSLKDLAAQAKTTEVTVLYFCSRLGFAGYADLKRQLQQNIKMLTSPNAKIEYSLKRLCEQENPYTEIINREKSNLDQTYRYIDYNVIRIAIDEIKHSKNIYILSNGGSEIVARFLKYRFEQVGFASTLIDLAYNSDFLNITADLSKDSLFFIVTFPRYSKNIVACAEYLNTIHARMLCLTDSITSAVSKIAIATLTCNSESSIFYNSITSAISLVEFLVSALAIECSSEFLQHRQKIDRARILLEECKEKIDSNIPSEVTAIKPM